MKRTLHILFILFIISSPLWAQNNDDFFEEYETESQEAKIGIVDPLYYYNKGMTTFNDIVLNYGLTPLAKCYSKIVPRRVQLSINNFYKNISSPIWVVNSSLQMKFSRSGKHLTRLLINTTLGIGGLFDPAAHWFDIKRPPQEDFGQTLGYYGVGPGFYIVLPMLGPSNLRDTLSRVGDFYLFPVNYLENTDLNIAYRFADTVNDLALDPTMYSRIKDSSIDFYPFLMNAYHQNRLQAIRD